jgi:DNA polymerase III gamma/tau subunit
VFQALYRKWRPRVFEDVVGQPQITSTLLNELRTGCVGHAYLFTGSRGTGKTTCAKILAKAVNCLDPHDGDPCNACDICRGIDSGAVLDVVEIDAASNNGVDNIRDLREETAFSPAAAKYRVYIIDEAHMLSGGAFNALLKTLEEPPAYVIFILATTEVHKIPATILSRCQRFDFRRIPAGGNSGAAPIHRRLRATGREEALASTAADDPALLRGLAARATPAELDYFVACVSELLSRLTRTAIRRTDGEMCLMKMALRGSAAPAPAADPAAAAAPAPAPQPPVRTEGPLRAAAAPQPAPDGQPAPAEQSAPAAVPPPAPAAGSPEKLKNAVLSMVQSKVTPAVRTYLRMAEFSDERGALLIRVREEALGFMAKPALLDLLRETAQALSYTDVVVKGPAPAAPSDALTDLLKNARELGVETK